MNLLPKKRFIVFVCIVALIVLVRWTGVHEYLTLENLRANKHHLQRLVESDYLMSLLLPHPISLVTVLYP